MASITYGDDLMFNAMDHGRPPQAFIDFVSNSWNQLTSLPGLAGNAIVDSTNFLVDQIQNVDVYSLAEQALQFAKNLWGKDTFQMLETLAKIQNAPNCMVPYLMANKAIRELYQKGQCEAYGDRYIDANPDTIGDSHYEWQMVMNGVIEFDDPDDDDNHGWTATTYATNDPRYDDVEDLTHIQSMDIRDAWARMEQAIKEGRDPTSRWDSDL